MCWPASCASGARPLVADLNAVSPDTVRELERTAAAAGIDLVDGSISGSPRAPGGTTRLYLSGPRAGEVAALEPQGMRPSCSATGSAPPRG